MKAQIAYKLQDIVYQANELIPFRKSLVGDMVRKVRELNKENFAVRQHLKYVELYSDPDNYTKLTYEDTLLMGQELAPLIVPEENSPEVPARSSVPDAGNRYGLPVMSISSAGTA